MRILVVDDSRTMRMLVIRALRQAGYDGYEMAEAADGLEALEVLRTMPVDLVLCDWNMPRMTGLELLQALRGAGDFRLFGFITSESNPTMRGLADAEGAAFVMTKPFTADAIQSVLGGSGVVEHASLLHHGLPTVVDLNNLLEPMLGRLVETSESRQQVPPADAAVSWSYVFPNQTPVAAGALDLPLASALAVAFGMLSKERMAAALQAGGLDDDLLANLSEVLNVLVSLYSSLSDQHIGLANVSRGSADGTPIGAILDQQTGRLDAQVRLAGYGEGRLSTVFASR